MFSLILYYVRFFIRFAYPLHDALTSYQRKDEKCFSQLVKYFFVLSLTILLENLLRQLFSGFLFESLLLVLAGLLIYNEYNASEVVFDFIVKKYSMIGGSKLEKYINQASALLNQGLKWVTKKVYKPVKGFVKNHAQRYFTNSVFGAQEKEQDSDDEKEVSAEHEESHAEKHGKHKHHKNKLD